MTSFDKAKPDEFAPLFEPSYTIPEFCRVERISQAYYAKIRAMGLGPEEMRIGTVVRITHTKRLEWQERMMNPPPELAAKKQEEIEKLKMKGRLAAKLSVQSPRHISNVRLAARDAREAEQAAIGKRKRARAEA